MKQAVKRMESQEVPEPEPVDLSGMNLKELVQYAEDQREKEFNFVGQAKKKKRTTIQVDMSQVPQPDDDLNFNLNR